MTQSCTASPEAVKNAIALSNYIPLDAPRWSDHPEIDILVTEFYGLIDKPHNVSERRAYRTLKILLLNLYVDLNATPIRCNGIG